jgi:hypothetical protein
MLHAISWNEYFIVMGLCLVVYYGWWLVRYYSGLKLGQWPRADRKDLAIPDAKADKSPLNEMEAEGQPTIESAGETAEAIGEPDQAVPVERQDIIEKELPPSELGATDQAVLLAKLATELMEKLSELMSEAQVQKKSAGQLIQDLRRLLGREPYCKLRGTPFEEKIGQWIGQEWSKEGAAAPDADVLKGLWYYPSAGSPSSI